MTPHDVKASDSQRIYLDIEGMTCGFCVRHVEKALTKIDGVTASVHLATRTATVDIEGDTGIADLCAAVDAAGYSATQRTNGPPPVPDSAAEGRIAAIRGRLVTLVPKRFQPGGAVQG